MRPSMRVNRSNGPPSAYVWCSNDVSNDDRISNLKALGLPGSLFPHLTLPGKQYDTSQLTGIQISRRSVSSVSAPNSFPLMASECHPAYAQTLSCLTV